MILMYKRECVLALLLCLSMAATAAAEREHSYRLRIVDDSNRVEIEARFAAAVTGVHVRSNRGPRYLSSATDCDGRALVRRGRSLHAEDGRLECLRYSVDLGRLRAGDRRNATLARSNTLAPPSRWLWRPRDRVPIVVSLELPDGYRVSAPWERLDAAGQRYRFGPSPENASAAVAFGRFTEAVRPIAGGEVRVVLLEPASGRAPAALIDWAATVAADVADSYGSLPNPSPHVLIVPVGGSRSSSPVPFGRVIRDGGESVEFFVNQNARIDRFYADWTATHEFSHLLFPYVRKNQRWISEGFAQYLQNVLLARAGHYTPERAWQKLYEGFERGRRSRPDLSPNAAAARGARSATMKVYWSGAVLALAADLELRRSSGGRQSLDTVIVELGDCCLPSVRSWSGTELLAKLDELAGRAVFMPLYRQYADAEGFPDYAPLFAELGLSVNRGRVVLGRELARAALRDAILAPTSPRLADTETDDATTSPGGH